MKKVFISIAFLTGIAFSQAEESIWFFGNEAGLDFSTGQPISVSGSAMNTSEGCATVCSPQGALLFYTDGETVWDRNHAPMPNGTGLRGGASSSQSALIVPFFNDTNLYYIFTVPHWSGNIGQFYHSIVDLRLNGGLGDVIPGQKNIIIRTGVTEKLTAIQGDCHSWVIVHGRNNNKFYTYKIDHNGLSATPILSEVGTPHVNGTFVNWTGLLKASPNNSKLAITTLNGIVELFDFDAETGKVTNPVHLAVSPENGNTPATYGICFSPDNTKLYVAESFSSVKNHIYQYDISTHDSAIIAGSKALIATTQMGGNFTVFDMKIGPDEKIYIVKHGKEMDVINQPNLSGMACNYQINQLFLTFGSGKTGLPNVIVRPRNTHIPTVLLQDTIICPQQSITLDVTNPNATYLWQDGNTNAVYTFDTAGLYQVIITNGCGAISGSFKAEKPLPDHFLPEDQTLCEGDSLQVELDLPNTATFFWENNTTIKTRKFTQGGTYWLEASLGACTYRDSLTIDDVKYPEIELGNDTLICQGDTIYYAFQDSSIIYNWSDGSNSPIKKIFAPGKYQLTMDKSSCIAKDIRVVTVLAPPNIDFGADTTICYEESYWLSIDPVATNWYWQDGSVALSKEVLEAGEYSLFAENICGAASDTISIEVEYCKCNFYIPNAFSPNEDGINDYFYIKNTCILAVFDLSIYDKWGKLIFNSTDPHFTWFGKYRQAALPDGTYAWKLNFRLPGASIISRKSGTLQLIR